MTTVVAQSSVGEPVLATGQQGSTDFTFRQVRQLTQALAPGVVGANDLKVAAGGGMSVNVLAGPAYVEAKDDTADRYLYPIPSLGTTVNLSGITAPTTATRRDIVVARVYDNGEDGLGVATADARVQYIKNAAESLTAEATPDNSLLLAYVDVTVGAGAITSGMITDMRTCAIPTNTALSMTASGVGAGAVPTSATKVPGTLALDTLAAAGPGMRGDTTNARIYVNATGLYRVRGSYAASGSAANAYATAQIRVNGNASTPSSLQFGVPGNGAIGSIAADQILPLTAGDYVELWAYSLNGVNYANGAQLQAQRIA